VVAICYFLNALQESGTVLLPNVCSTALEDLDRKPSAEEEERLRWAVGTVMGGGMDTVIFFTLTFQILNRRITISEHFNCVDILPCDDVEPRCAGESKEGNRRRNWTRSSPHDQG
jgi:hypothetical protein